MHTAFMIAEYRDNCKMFSNSEVDVIILAQIHSQFQYRNSEASTSESGQTHHRCTSSIAKFFLQWQACMSKDIPILTYKRYANLVDHYKCQGLTP